MTKQEIYQQIDQFYQEFQSHHQTGNKSADRKARKALGRLKSLITDYRRASVEESK